MLYTGYYVLAVLCLWSCDFQEEANKVVTNILISFNKNFYAVSVIRAFMLICAFVSAGITNCCEQ